MTRIPGQMRDIQVHPPDAHKWKRHEHGSQPPRYYRSFFRLHGLLRSAAKAPQQRQQAPLLGLVRLFHCGGLVSTTTTACDSCRESYEK